MSPRYSGGEGYCVKEGGGGEGERERERDWVCYYATTLELRLILNVAVW